jgi:hypothetical protein
MSARVSWKALSPRERDALVAERVMGWRRYRSSYHPCYALLSADLLRDGAMVDQGAEVPAEPCRDAYGRVPHYTTDIAAAWEVVEQFKADGVWFSIESNAVEWEADIRTVVNDDDEQVIRLGVGYAMTAPEAICIAALRACGVEVEV